MDTTHDLIVVGVGGIGAATCYWAARAGLRVLGIEQFQLGHGNGSSEDHSRVLRLAHSQAPYAALARQAYGAWREVEEDGRQALLTVTGGLMIDADEAYGPGVVPTITVDNANVADVPVIVVASPYHRFTRSIPTVAVLAREARPRSLPRAVKEGLGGEPCGSPTPHRLVAREGADEAGREVPPERMLEALARRRTRVVEAADRGNLLHEQRGAAVLVLRLGDEHACSEHRRHRPRP